MSRFPNKAGDHADTDDILRAELAAAGIPTLQESEGQGPDYLADMLRRNSGEVKTSVIGCLHGWQFTRAWYYWIAKGPGIEVDAAERLHAEHGRTVRVAGHCGCPSPREWFKGLACDSYHVDDSDGLKALADTIKELVARQPGEVQRLYALVRHWSGEARRLEDENARLRTALQRVDLTLTVPAAEYVPAIGDAFVLIRDALNVPATGAAPSCERLRTGTCRCTAYCGTYLQATATGASQ